MKFLEAVRDFEFTANGGFAIYMFLCVAFVTIAGIYQIGALIANILK